MFGNSSDITSYKRRFESEFVHEDWFLAFENNLRTFARNEFPSHEHLAVCIGVAKILHERDGHYKSFVQPLISGIATLFHHLESEVNIQSAVSQLLFFSSMFNDLSNTVIQKYKLLIFGQSHSSIDFFELLGETKIDNLYKNLNQSFYAKSDSFSQMRVMQRLLNEATFSSKRGVLDDEVCRTRAESCFCTYYDVKLSVPKLPETKQCLGKISNFKFQHNGSTFLAHSSEAVTLSRDQSNDKLLKQLPPPVVQLRGGVNAFFVSKGKIFFPLAANETIRKKCNGGGEGGGAYETEIEIRRGTIISIDKGCNYSSPFFTCFYQGPLSVSHVNNSQPIYLPKLYFESFSQSLDTKMMNLVEKSFQDSLVAEDAVVSDLHRVISQSWLELFLFHLLDYFLPSAAVVFLVVFLIIVLYLWRTLSCFCCSHRSESYKIDNLQKRLDKVENFTQYFLCNSFHDLEINDLKKRLEMRKTSQSGEAAKDPSEGSA